MGQSICDAPEASSLPASISINPTIYLVHSLFTSSELRGERTVGPPSLQFTVSHATRAVGNWGIEEWGITEQIHGTQQARHVPILTFAGSGSTPQCININVISLLE